MTGIGKLASRWAAVAALSVTVVATTEPLPSNAAVATLQPYTAPDKSASAGVPAGWNVSKAQNGVIMMSGPSGERIGLGAGIIVHNGAFRAGASGPPPVNATMPNQASLSQKLLMVFAQSSAEQGEATPQVNIISATPIAISPQIAQCGTFLGTSSTAQGTSKFESQFCSLAMDTNGFYKLIWKMASIPDAVAAQERATAEAVLHSYKVSRASLNLMLQPVTPRVQAVVPRFGAGGGMGGMNSSTINAAIGADHSAECMDLGVIREVPEGLLPPYCR